MVCRSQRRVVMEITGGKKREIEGCRRLKRMKQAKNPTRNPMGGGGEHAWTLGSRYKLRSPLFVLQYVPCPLCPTRPPQGSPQGPGRRPRSFRGCRASAETPRFSPGQQWERHLPRLERALTRPSALYFLEATVPHQSRTSPEPELHQTPGGHASLRFPRQHLLSNIPSGQSMRK